MLAAANSRANAVHVADKLVDQARPLTCCGDEMSVATMVRGDEIVALKFPANRDA
jgi:hypothetical protein